MKTINLIKRVYYKMSSWVDRHLGTYLCNPANHYRWKERHGIDN